MLDGGARSRLRQRAGGVDDGGAAMLLPWRLQEQMLDGGDESAYIAFLLR